MSRARGVRRRGPARVRGAVLGRLLDYHAARRVRRARRLSAPHRPVVAVPHLPLVPGIQRCRDRALDILSVRRSAAAPGDAGGRSPAVLRALREDGAAVVVDGRGLSASGAARRRRCPLRAVHVLRDGASDGGAVLRHSCRRRHRHDAAARERVSGAPRARHPDADGPRLRRQHRAAAALHPAGAPAARRVAAGRDGVLRDIAVSDYADAAVVLGGRDAVRQSCRRPRPPACGRAMDDGVRVYGDAERGQRALVLCRVQQVAGSAEGALHAAARTSTRSRRGCRCRSCAGICSSRM